MILWPHICLLCTWTIYYSHAYTVKRRLSGSKLSVKLSALAYADDVAILSDTAESSQAQLQNKRVSEKVDLKLCLLKSMVMFVGAEAASIKSSTGTPLTVCEDYRMDIWDHTASTPKLPSITDDSSHWHLRVVSTNSGTATFRRAAKCSSSKPVYSRYCCTAGGHGL